MSEDQNVGTLQYLGFGDAEPRPEEVEVRGLVERLVGSAFPIYEAVVFGPGEHSFVFAPGVASALVVGCGAGGTGGAGGSNPSRSDRGTNGAGGGGGGGAEIIYQTVGVLPGLSYVIDVPDGLPGPPPQRGKSGRNGFSGGDFRIDQLGLIAHGGAGGKGGPTAGEGGAGGKRFAPGGQGGDTQGSKVEGDDGKSSEYQPGGRAGKGDRIRGASGGGGGGGLFGAGGNGGGGGKHEPHNGFPGKFGSGGGGGGGNEKNRTPGGGGAGGDGIAILVWVRPS